MADLPEWMEPLPVYLRNALHNAGPDDIDRVRAMSDLDLLRTKNIGRTALAILASTGVRRREGDMPLPKPNENINVELSAEEVDGLILRALRGEYSGLVPARVERLPAGVRVHFMRAAAGAKPRS